MLGDPKQAIYSFRGGDIYAYINAAKDAKPRFTLSANFRSEPNLIAAVNRVFEQNGVFVEKGIAYHNSLPGEGNLKHKLLHNGKEILQPLQIVQGGGKNAETVRHEVTRDVVSRVVRMLGDSRAEIWLMRETNGETRALRPSDFAVLVQKNAEAVSVQSAFAASGVPAVIYKAGNIFKTDDAKNIFHLLSAMARPSRDSLVKTALLTPHCGKDAPALLQHAGSENTGDGAERSAAEPLGDAQQKFARYGEFWRERGVVAALNTLASDFGTFQNFASRKERDGARRLTNFRHLRELLHEREAHAPTAPDMLLQWLAKQMNDDSGDNAEIHEQRLESDSRAITIMTVHKSKGLEFPIVFCPFLALKNTVPRHGALWTVHERDDHGEALPSLLLPIDAESKDAFRDNRIRETCAEDARLFYVALTRAANYCVLHNAGTKQTPSYLAGFLRDNTTSLDRGKNIKFTERATGSATAGTGETCIQEQTAGILNKPPTPPPVPTGEIVMSYSSICRHGNEQVRDLLITPKETGETHMESETESTVGDAETSGALAHDPLPAGVATGLCLHEIMERLDYTCVHPNWKPDSDAESLINNTVRKHGVWSNREDSKQVRARRERMEKMIETALTTPILTDDAPDFSLSQLTRAATLREWEFLCKVPKRISPEFFAEWKGQGLSFSHATAATAGFMTGFVDLIFKHNERYYFADWKTDMLPDYSPAALDSAMRARNYKFQAVIYAATLFEWLRKTLGESFEFARHFGGGVYLFTRGISTINKRQNHTHETSGIYRFRPTEDSVRKWNSEFYESER